MTKPLTPNDTVRISDREATAADTKSGLFYPHYRGLTGIIAKVYPDETATVTIDSGSLPPDLRARHVSGTSAMRQKWLDGLSDEARNRLSAAEKKFDLRYTILVAVSELSPNKVVQPALDIDPEPSRLSTADLDNEEARHLAEVARKKKDKPEP